MSTLYTPKPVTGVSGVSLTVGLVTTSGYLSNVFYTLKTSTRFDPMCPKRKHWFATIHLQHCFPESVSQWRNVERPLCSLPDFECTQTGSCGSQPKIWVLGLYWLESLASLLQIYQVDSCDSCILTNQSGGFWLGRYVFRFCWGRVSIWTVYHPCSPRFFWLPLRHGQVVASSCQTAFALAVYKSPVLIHPTRNASVVR